MTEPPPLPIAIVGFAGVIGRRHVAEVLANPAVRLAAVVDPAPASPATAAQLGVPHYATVEALLAATKTPAITAAIVCTPNATHAAVTRALAAAGVHLLLEKPLAVCGAEGERLVAALRAATGVRVLVGHQRRFDASVETARAALQAGRLGGVTAVSALWTAHKPEAYFGGGGSGGGDADTRPSWRADPAAGGGVLRINLVHDVDVLQHWLGPITRVHAEATVGRRGPAAPPAGAAPAGAALVFRFRSGVVGTCLVSDHVASPYSYEGATRTSPALAAVDGPVDAYRLFGTDATLSVPDMQLWSYAGTKSWQEPMQREVLPPVDPPGANPFARQLAHFIDVVRGAAAPRCSIEEALRAVAVCDAVEAALAQGGVAEVVDYEV